MHLDERERKLLRKHFVDKWRLSAAFRQEDLRQKMMEDRMIYCHQRYLACKLLCVSTVALLRPQTHTCLTLFEVACCSHWFAQHCINDGGGGAEMGDRG